MDTETNFLQDLFGIQVFSLAVIGHEFFLAQLIEIAHNGIVGWLQLAVIGAVGDSEPGVQLGQQDFNGVDLRVCKILVTSKKVF